MSVADAGSSSSGLATDWVGVGLEPEELWDLRGASLFAMACALLGDRTAALRAVTLGMVDLYTPSENGPWPAGEGPRLAARCVYRRCLEMFSHEPTRWSMTGPPLMTWLGQVALFQHRTLALCVFGRLAYREAATTLDLPADSVARLLISGLQELAWVASTEIGAQP